MNEQNDYAELDRQTHASILRTLADHIDNNDVPEKYVRDFLAQVLTELGEQTGTGAPMYTGELKSQGRISFGRSREGDEGAAIWIPDFETQPDKGNNDD